MPNPPSPGTPWSWRVGLALGIVGLTTVTWLGQSTLGPRGQAAIGVVCFLSVGLACSTDIRAINRRTVLTGIGLQVFLALMVLRVPPVRHAFEWMGGAAKKFTEFSAEGGSFVFGPLVNMPAIEKGLGLGPGGGMVFAFVALPAVIFVSSFFTVLYHLGVLQLVVRAFARAMRWVMGTSGAETLSVTANVFMGQTEAPLIVKPYIPRMTRSELLALMVGGMAHISGGADGRLHQHGGRPGGHPGYQRDGRPVQPLPGQAVAARRPGMPETRGRRASRRGEKAHANVIDAAAAGASEGMQLAINIAAMLIAFIAFIALVNCLLGLASARCGGWRLGRDAAAAVAAEAVRLGVRPGGLPDGRGSGTTCRKVGELLGTKLVLNEFVAFSKLTGQYKPGIELA